MDTDQRTKSLAAIAQKLGLSLEELIQLLGKLGKLTPYELVMLNQNINAQLSLKLRED